MLALPKESLGYTAPMGVPPKVQPMFVSSTERITGLHRTHGRLPRALFQERTAIVCFAKNQALFPEKKLTPCWAPKDVKSSTIIEEFFARVKKFGLHEFLYKGAIPVQKLISIIIAHTYIVIKLLACSLNKPSNKEYNEKCSSNGLVK